jgi:hypothetical protein
VAALQNFIANSPPTIKAVWLNAVDALLNTLFNGATTASQARDALEVSAQPTYRNRIINGRFQTAQFANTITTGTGFICDMWLVAGNGGTFSGARVLAPGLADFPYFGRINSGAANVINSTAFWLIEHRVEGVMLDDFNWGTTSAATLTLSFWARVSVPGTYSYSIRNAGAARSYVGTFTASSNAWSKYVFTIPGDTAGTWLGPGSNLLGMTVDFCASSGTTFMTSVLDTWQNGNFIAATSQTGLMSVNGATFDVTGVQLERGAIATPYEMVPHVTDLARCQRYYEQSSVTVVGYAPVAPMIVQTHFNERVFKRASPSVSVQQVFATVGISNAAFGYVGVGPPHVLLTIGVTGTYSYQVTVAIDARL